MKKKLLFSSIIPILAFAVIGVSQASAHGWLGLGDNATPEEVATQQTLMFQSQAALLGLSVDVIKQGWAEGKTLEEIATANGVSATDLQAKMKAAAKTRLTERMQALVSQGVITQAQADQRLQLETARIDSGTGKGPGGRGGHHGGPGGLGGF